MHPFHFVRNRKLWLLVMLVVGALLLGAIALTPQGGIVAAQGPKPLAVQLSLGTGFTYQGQLKSSGAPVNGACDLRFALYNAPSGGAQVGMTLTAMVPVTGGLFTTALDFGTGAFTGDARWLDIQAACPSGGSYAALTPRQALTPAPMALALPGLWTQQNAFSPNLIGGYSGNLITPTLAGATIGGGGSSGFPNRAWSNFATVGGGVANTASGYVATVGGGNSNIASAYGATVGGGDSNIASGDRATVGGGLSNYAGDSRATVGGGTNNIASAPNASVGGGFHNTASAPNATAGGGAFNIASGGNATVGGGYTNTASGPFATVLGGDQNFATMTSTLAAGHRAKANHTGAFVWADSTDFDFASTGNDQFFVRASGGVHFFLTPFSGFGGPHFSIDSSGNYGLFPSSGSCSLTDGAVGWSCSSDRNLKENFAAVDGRDILQRLSHVPLTQWNIKKANPSIQHLGPMAQDFYAAFGLGEDDTHINSTDAQGVAFAAIQGLYQVVQEKDAKIAAQQKQIVELQKQNASVEERLTALEQQAKTANPASNAQPVMLALGTLVMLGFVYQEHRAYRGRLRARADQDQE